MFLGLSTSEVAERLLLTTFDGRGRSGLVSLDASGRQRFGELE